MTDKADRSKLHADLWEIYVDGDRFYFEGGVSLDVTIVLEPMTSARTGANVLGHRVMGGNVTGTITLNQADAEAYEMAIGTDANGKLPATGSEPDYHVVRLHDPQAEDNDGDIRFEAALHGLSRTYDGNGMAQYEIPFVTRVDADNSALTLGDAEALDGGGGEGEE